MDLTIGKNSGKFKVRADSLRKLHSYLSLYLKRLKYTIEDSEVDEARMVIRAARGSKLFHALLDSPRYCLYVLVAAIITSR